MPFFWVTVDHTQAFPQHLSFFIFTIWQVFKRTVYPLSSHRFSLCSHYHHKFGMHPVILYWKIRSWSAGLLISQNSTIISLQTKLFIGPHHIVAYSQQCLLKKSWARSITSLPSHEVLVVFMQTMLRFCESPLDFCHSDHSPGQCLEPRHNQRPWRFARAQRDPQWGDGFPSPSIMGWGYQLDIFHQISSDFIRFHQIIIYPNMEFSGFSATYIGIGDNWWRFIDDWLVELGYYLYNHQSKGIWWA